MTKEKEHTAIDISSPPYKLTAEQVAQELETNLETGLSINAAKQKLEQYGPNKLDGGEGVAVWEVLFKQLSLATLPEDTNAKANSGIEDKKFLNEANCAMAGDGLRSAVLLTIRVILTGRKRHDSCPYSRNGFVLWCPRLG